MTNRVLLKVLPFLLLASQMLVTGWVSAHSSVNDEIERLTASIQNNPKDASQYLARAVKQLDLGHNKAALEDLVQVEALEANHPRINLFFSLALARLERLKEAQDRINRHLLLNPDHKKGLHLRARVSASLQDRSVSLGDYNRLIQLSSNPGAELYIERAEMLLDGGPQYYDEALSGLNQGIENLGDIPLLSLVAIRVQRKQQAWPQALRRVNLILHSSTRKETWWSLRGDIELESGEASAAIKSYQQALLALSQLPGSRRDVPAMRDLEQSLREKLAQATALAKN